MTEHEVAEEFARADEYSRSLLLRAFDEAPGTAGNPRWMDWFAYFEESGYQIDQALRRWWKKRYPAVWYKLYHAWQRSGVDNDVEPSHTSPRRKGKWDL